MKSPLMRPLAYAWHRLAGARWWRLARAAEREARAAFARNATYAARARAHDAEVRALYPPPGTGPPGPGEAAGREIASAHQGGPQSRGTGRAARLPSHPHGIDVAGG